MQAASELRNICKDDGHTKENMKTANGLLQRLLNIATEVRLMIRSGRQAGSQTDTHTVD